MKSVRLGFCVLFGLVFLFSLSVTAANACSPKEGGSAEGIWHEMNEYLGQSFDFFGNDQGNQASPCGWGVGVVCGPVVEIEAAVTCRLSPNLLPCFCLAPA